MTVLLVKCLAKSNHEQMSMSRWGQVLHIRFNCFDSLTNMSNVRLDPILVVSKPLPCKKFNAFVKANKM